MRKKISVIVFLLALLTSNIANSKKWCIIEPDKVGEDGITGGCYGSVNGSLCLIIKIFDVPPCTGSVNVPEFAD